MNKINLDMYLKQKMFCFVPNNLAALCSTQKNPCFLYYMRMIPGEPVNQFHLKCSQRYVKKKFGPSGIKFNSTANSIQYHLYELFDNFCSFKILSTQC